jgi:octaheme c-type cytochrome (tetrathionate reductase family)
VGYGWKDDSFDFTDPSRVDCLVCHDTTGSYEKVPTGAGLPAPEVDLVYVAENVGRTSRQTCGDCHFSGGGGDAVKHGDMSENLNWPSRGCDVHMGGYDFRCTECHKTRSHRIRGRSTSVCVAEGSRACEDCHTAAPHYADTILDHHLNEHCATVACNTCHSPIYAKCAPTNVWWDWSTAGDTERQVKTDKYGKPDYHWKKGSFRWREAAKPVYAWFNGYTRRLLLGETINPETGTFRTGETLTLQEKMALEVTHITEPVGAITDPNSKITPFKVMSGIQPADAVHRYLLVPHLYPYDEHDLTAYWKVRDWHKAFAEGMRKADLAYSGDYVWVRTDMYWRIEHEVMPKEFALSCAHCHSSLAGDRTCDRCHRDRRDVDYRSLCRRGINFSGLASGGRDVEGLIVETDYIDFKKLGYEGDPIVYGGRFKSLPLRFRRQ